MRKNTLFNSLMWSILCGALGFLAPARAQTSLYPQVSVAGSFNNWDTTNTPMRLAENNVWQTDIIITNASFEFKFTRPAWATVWGDQTQPNTILPISGTADMPGNNILVDNPSANKLLRFTINVATREYSVFLLNNVGTNLLFNNGFEDQSWDQYHARYWDLNQPNLHGGYNGPANRTDYGTPYKGSYVANIMGTWANQGNSGSLWQEAPVEAGVPYKGSAWFQAENSWTAGVQELRLEFYDFNKASQLASYSQTIPTNTIWYQVAVTGVAPARAAWSRLVYNVAQAGQAGSLRIDDAFLQATAARRIEDFNDWNGYTTPGDYMRAGWRVSTGKMVSSYVFETVEIPLSRSGWAASLSNPGGTTNGSIVLSPRFMDGLGTIVFYYRHGFQGDPDDSPDAPVSFEVQVSFLGDFWTTVAAVSNISSLTYQKFELFQYITSPYYMRIVHSGGSTNSLLIDDLSIAVPTDQPRLMDFNSWPDSATNPGIHAYLNWQVHTGTVSTADAKDGKSARIFGSATASNYLRSPKFDNGYGNVSFSYRLAGYGSRTLGISIEASTNNTHWTVLDTITNIQSLKWMDYSGFFFQPVPHYIRLRNVPETNVANIADVRIAEPFDTGSIPPVGWTFNKIGEYTSVASSGQDPPSIAFNQDGSYAETPAIAAPTNARFMILGNTVATDSVFSVQVRYGSDPSWVTVTSYMYIAGRKITNSVNLSTNVTQLRFEYAKVGGNVAFDDLIVTGPRLIVGPQPPQILLLDDVNIAEPAEARMQDFNSWPQKAAYTYGTSQHMGWVLSGLSVVDTNQAYAGQSARLMRSSSASGYFVDFEGDKETKGTYPSGNVTLSGKSWNLTDVLIGTDANDWKNGVRSARLRGYGASSMTMNEDKASGLGTLSFLYRRYGTDTQVDWMVQYSTNGGLTWVQIGSNFTAPANDTVQTFSQVVNKSGNIRIRIKRATETGSSNRRLNIDDINMTDFGGGGSVDPETLNPFIMTHYMPGGIGSISFRYRHWMNTAPPASAIMATRIQTSSNGVNWITQDTLMVSNINWALYEKFVYLTNHYYMRLSVSNGSSIAMFDDVYTALPQPPAQVQLTGSSTPLNPYTNDSVTLTAECLAQYGAHSVTVTSYYRIGTTGAYQAMAMLANGSTYTSISNIPPKLVGTIVQYYFKADFKGPGSELSTPVYYPTNYASQPLWYGIPRNPPGLVWINEIDYNAFNWETWYETEFVELAGRAGINIAGWKIEFRDGRTTAYALFDSYTLPLGTTIPNQTNGFGFYVLGDADLAAPPRNMTKTNSLAMRLPGAVRLLNEMNGVEHSLAYGGTVPTFNRIRPEDVEPNDVPSNCVFLAGTGTSSVHFTWYNKDGITWTNYAPTPGAANLGQVFADPSMAAAIPTNLVFSYIAGSYAPPAQLLVISNAGSAALFYSLATNIGWLTVAPVSNANLAPGAIMAHTVTVHTAGLTGERNGQITLTGSAANSPVAIPVRLTEIALETPLLFYRLDDSPDVTVYNGGSIGSAANLLRQNGAAWTLEGSGISGRLGDFALVSMESNSHAGSSGSVPGLTNLSQFTIAGWIKTSSTNGHRLILGNRSANQGFAVQTTSNGQDVALLSSAGSAATAISATNGGLANGQWHFFAITFDATNTGNSAVCFYRGGISNGSYLASTRARGDLGATGNSTGHLYIAGTLLESCMGTVDDLRLCAGVQDYANIEAMRQEGVNRSGTIPIPPSITVQPPDSTGWVYTVHTLGVTAEGSPTPRYIWRHNGAVVSNEIENTIVFNPLLLADDGNYDVIVYNVAGIVTSRLAKLLVLAVPEMLVAPKSQTVYEGETVVFAVSATGTPPFKYQWSMNGSPLPGETNPSYTIGYVATNYNGLQYSVYVTNMVGFSNSYPATLTVKYMTFEGGGGMQTPPTGQGMVLKWPSIQYRTYDVLWTTNLMMGEHGYQLIASNLPSTASNLAHITYLNWYTDTAARIRGYGFYRVRSNKEE